MKAREVRGEGEDEKRDVPGREAPPNTFLPKIRRVIPIHGAI